MNARLRQVVGFTKWLLSYLITMGLLVMFGVWAYSGFTASHAQLASAWARGAGSILGGLIVFFGVLFPIVLLMDRKHKDRTSLARLKRSAVVKKR